MSVDEAQALTAIDPWFLTQVKQLIDEDEAARRAGAALLDDPAGLLHCKQLGMSDSPADESWPAWRGGRASSAPAPRQSGRCSNAWTPAPRNSKRTPYLYSTYESGTLGGFQASRDGASQQSRLAPRDRNWNSSRQDR